MSKMKDTLPDPYDYAYQQGYAQGRNDAAEAMLNLMMNAKPGSITHMMIEAARGLSGPCGVSDWRVASK